MSRKTKVELARLPVTPPAVPPADDAGAMLIQSTQTPTEARRENELEDILADIGSDTRVKVSRLSESGSMQSCGEMSGDGFSVEGLADTFGGGKYLLRFFQGKSEIDRTRVEVDSLIPPKNPRAPRGAVPVGSQPGSPSMDTAVVGTMMTMMQTMQAGTAALIGTMVEVMKARPVENPLDMAVKLAELTRRDGPGNSAQELIGMLREGMNLAGKLNPGADSDSVIPIIGEGVRAVGSVLDGIAAEKKANAAAMTRRTAEATATIVRPVAEVPAPAVSVAAAAVEVPVNEVPLTMLYRKWVAAALPFKAVLLTMIGRAQPANAAALVMDVLDDDQLDDLVNDIEDDTAPGFLARTFAAFRGPDAPVTEKEIQWLAEVATAVTESVDPVEDDQAPAPEGNTNAT